MCVYPIPLTSMWCNIKLYINDVSVNNITDQYNRSSYLKGILCTPYNSCEHLTNVKLDILDGARKKDSVDKIASNTIANDKVDKNGKMHEYT